VTKQARVHRMLWRVHISFFWPVAARSYRFQR